MYLSYFGLQEVPFRITPDTRYLFMTQQYESALTSLEYAITQRMGFLVLTGEVGTGKTTLTRQLLQQLGPDVATALLLNPLLSPQELLRSINRDLGVSVRSQSLDRQLEALNDFLLKLHREEKTALVVIDECQNLSFESLEMVRMLSNLETDQAKLVQILLVGQPELERKLASHELRQLRQRVGVHVALRPLSYMEMVRYISHRLSLAGGQSRIYFEPAAYRAIFRRTKGYPRLVNLLCDRALMAAYAGDTVFIGAAVIRRAYRDLYPRRAWLTLPAWWRRVRAPLQQTSYPV